MIARCGRDRTPKGLAEKLLEIRRGVYGNHIPAFHGVPPSFSSCCIPGRITIFPGVTKERDLSWSAPAAHFVARGRIFVMPSIKILWAPLYAARTGERTRYT